MQNPAYSSLAQRGSRYAGLLLIALLATACAIPGSSLRTMITDYRQFEPEVLQAVIEERSSVRFEVAQVPDGRLPLDALIADETDLALIENNVAFKPGIRAVLPVFESVLHIAGRDAFYNEDPARGLEGANFFIANRSSAGHTFVKLVMGREGFSPDQYRISTAYEPGVTDFIVYFGPINPGNTSWIYEGFSLVSLDDKLNPQRKFYEEGIGYNAPGMKPTTIPALTYELPAGCRPRLMAIAPHLFAGINESFDPLDLNFPLHRGARSYLERDDPSFIERYAETINMLVYVSFLLISAFLAFARWREHKKKDRVDVFYKRVFEVRDGMSNASQAEKLALLNDIEREAFESLIKEKLSANESFRIFTDLLARTREEIRN